MFYHKRRGAIITCGIAAMLLAAPAQSSACCGWLFGGWGAQTTYRTPYFARTYAPVYSAPACTSCVPQTVRYVPQTSYRTVYRPVPVTSYAAQTCSDPCTGCPVTYYRPVTSWAYQAAYVPYTTYRLVYSNPYSPSVSYDPCLSCGPSVGTTFETGGACCPPSASGAADIGTVPPSGSLDSTNGQAPGGKPPPETFKQEGSKAAEESMKPVPDPKTSSIPGPDLTDPASRTTFRPARQAVRYRLIASPPKPVTGYQPKLDDGGWRAARD